jgi:GTP-binding protein
VTALLPRPAGPVVALVGRPNVGKSTLFNRLVGHRKAVVAPSRGTTRDRLYGSTTWRGTTLTLVDTGGVEPEAEGVITSAVQRHVGQALQEADVIVLICDAHEGLVPADQFLMDRLRTLSKPIILAVNKADHRAVVPPDFFTLGLDHPVPISALHGRGIGDLLDELCRHFPSAERADTAPIPTAFSITIIGRQNVGKSSLFNALLQEERVIVSDIPGTTRDAVDMVLTLHGTPVLLVDTAGLRHRRKVSQPVDLFAMSRTIDAIDRSDLVLAVLDATQGVTRDDRRMVDRVCTAGRSLMLLMNKWDLVKNGTRGEALGEKVHRALPFAAFAPVLPVSAKTGFQVSQIVPMALRIGKVMKIGLSDAECFSTLRRAISTHTLPRVRGRAVKIEGAHWVPARPAIVEIFTSPMAQLPGPCLHALRKALWHHPKAAGIPVRLVVKKAKKPVA